MKKTIFKKRIPALLLCAVMVAGMVPQGISAIYKAAEDVPPVSVTKNAQVEVEAPQKVSVTIPAVAEEKEEKGEVCDVATRKHLLASSSSSSPYSYKSAVIPDGSGTIKQDWNKSTKVLKLTAQPASGCTFLYWTEYVYDSESGDNVEKLLQSGDPYSATISYTVEPYVSRELIANFRKNGEYFIWNASAFSERGELTVSPKLDCYRPGKEITITVNAKSGYKVIGIEYGLAVKDVFEGSDGTEWIRISDSGTATIKMPSSDIWVRGVFYSTSPHTATITGSDPNGTITFENGKTTAQFKAGDKVKLVVTPKNDGTDKYNLSRINGITEDFSFEDYTFTMPDMDIEITGEFSKMKVYSIDFNYDNDALRIVNYSYDEKTGFITINAMPKFSNVIFLGWYDESGRLLCKDYDYSFFTASVTLTLKSVFGHYCAPYDLIGGTIENGSVSVYPERINPFASTAKSYYQTGEKVKLIGIPDEGYMLSGFYYAEVTDGNIGPTRPLNGDTITMGDNDVIVSALFVPAIDINATSNNNEWGSALGGAKYEVNRTATLTAVPNEGCEFVNWTENGAQVSTSAEYTFTATKKRDLVANFRKLVNVEAESSDEAKGTVSGAGYYQPNADVTLKATAAGDYVFVNWTKDGTEVSTSAEYKFKATEDVVLVANFRALYEYTVTVQSSNTDQGTVSGGGKVTEGGSVTIKAEPKTDYYFVKWTKNGADFATDAEYTFTPDGSVTLVAVFEHVAEYNVSVSTADASLGSVSGGGTYKTGASVTVTATPATDCVFESWTKDGNVVSSDPNYTFTVTENVTLVANFRQIETYTVSVQSSNTGYGTVSGGGSYKEGVSVTVKAEAETDCVFVNWTVDGREVSKDAEYRFTPITGVILTANFRKLENYTVTAVSSDDTKGSVTGGGTYKEGVEVTLKATAKEGYIFVEWTENGTRVSTDAEYKFTADKNRSLTANFTKKPHVIEYYPLYICGVQVTSDNKDNITGDGITGKVSYDGDATGGTLTLENATLSKMDSNEWCIYLICDSVMYEDSVDTPLTVNLIGDNKINAGNDLLAGIITNATVTILGPGKLTIEDAGNGIYAERGLTVNGATIVVTSCRSYPLWAGGGDIVFENGANLDLETSNPYAISTGKNLIIKDSRVTAVSKFYAIKCVSITIDHSYVYAKNKSDSSISCIIFNTNFTLSGGSKFVLPESAYIKEGPNPRLVDANGNNVTEFLIDCDSCTIEFYDDDGTLLQSSKIDICSMPEYKGVTPTKQADAQYTYTFKGWTPDISRVTGDATYTATYTKTTNEYTVKFVDEDGTELQSGKVAYGQTPAYTGEAPTKEATAEKTYSFAGWDKEIKAVTGDTTYTATYTSTVNEYTVEFVNDDDTVLQSGKLAYGQTPVYNGETPTKAGNAQYTHTFAGWDKTITSVTGNVTYKATYTDTTNTYTVKFVNYDGTELQIGSVAYGQTPVYNGEVPTKTADAQYTYTFKGWKPEINQVTGHATYTAEYDQTLNSYDVTFLVNGKTVTVIANYGSRIDEPEAPTKEGCDFIGWFTDEACTVPADFTQPVTEAFTLYAKFEEFFYSVEGDTTWSGDSGNDLSFSVKRNRSDENTFGLFEDIIFNGQSVGTEYYTAEQGSVKLTVKSELFETLPNGEYDLTVRFADGEVTAKITVEQKTVTPPTGDATPTVIIMACALAMISGIAIFAVNNRRRRSNG